MRRAPRSARPGPASLAEVFATAAISATSIVVAGVSLRPAILGLVPAGALAAPITALAVRRLPGRRWWARRCRCWRSGACRRR